MIQTALQKARQTYLPVLPSVLRDILNARCIRSEEKASVDPKIQTLFPLTSTQPLIRVEKGSKRNSRALQIGVVFSGGQAPGGHNVITGICDAMQSLNPKSKLFGFLDGPGGIVAGKCKELTKETLDDYRNQGGFDLIGSGRTKIETDDQLKASLETVKKMQLDGLIIIGGDDSNTNAAILAEYFLKNGSSTKVIGVPKTIDGDLQNAYAAIPFGFDTACKIYSEIIGNIARDVASAKRYFHFIKLMGRSASHIVLECALSTHPNMAIIGEEVAAQKQTLKSIVDSITDLVCKRAEIGKNYGVILIPEGLIEIIPECGLLIKELNQILAEAPSTPAASIPDKLTPPSRDLFSSFSETIQAQLLLNRDPHGNVQLSMIETETLLMSLVGKEVEARVKSGATKAKFSPLRHFLGYEARAGYPSNFDCNYCYALGFAATLLIDEGVTGYMACISNLAKSLQDWEAVGVPLASLMKMETRKGKEKPVIEKTLVDLKGKSFAHFVKHRGDWSLQDDYLYPGPIQFFGDAASTERIPLTLSGAL